MKGAEVKKRSIASMLACLALSACLVTAYAPSELAFAASDGGHMLTTGAIVTQSTSKQPSTIRLKAQTKAYTGEMLAYTGKVTRTPSKGKVTFRYHKTNLRVTGYVIRGRLSDRQGRHCQDYCLHCLEIVLA